MIKIREIDKEGTDKYFIVYELNNRTFSFNGDSKDVLEDLFKTNKEINEQ
jgi:hypothetical protein